MALPENRLRQQIALWEKAIDRSMTQVDAIDVEVAEERCVGDFW